jgi:hypothetical protein
MWQSRHPDCPPVALRTLSQKRDVSLFQLLSAADSAAFCTETTASQERFSMQCWLRLPSGVLNVTQFFMLLLPVPHQLLPYEQMRYVYIPLKVYHTHFLFLQTLTVQWIMPLDGATRKKALRNIISPTSTQKLGEEQKVLTANTLSRRVRHVSHLTSELSTTFPKCIKQYKKVEYNCVD